MTELPADIAAAIEAFDHEAQNCGLLGRATLGHGEARAALDAAILSRIALIRQQMGYRVEAAEAQLEAALARAERLEKALQDLVSADTGDFNTMHPDLARQRARSALSSHSPSEKE